MKSTFCVYNTWLVIWPTGSGGPCSNAVLLCFLACSHTTGIILFKFLALHQLDRFTQSWVSDQGVQGLLQNVPHRVFNQAADLDWWLVLLVCQLLLFAPVWHNKVSLTPVPPLHGTNSSEEHGTLMYVWLKCISYGFLIYDTSVSIHPLPCTLLCTHSELY